VWEGLGEGRGRLRRRELTITARGRGAAVRPRSARVQLPDPAGRLAPAPLSERPAAGRPMLTVVPGEALDEASESAAAVPSRVPLGRAA
jgi:hypothetical protein